MNIDKVIAALNSDLRRDILKTLAGQPMSAVEVFKELKRRRPRLNYRETVYRALEKLYDTGLVEKYCVREKGLCYRVSVTSLTIDLIKGTVSGTI